ncbi:MAG: class I SAM-dependent methyltransferase [Magnetococcus sp. THC-1_WYH]
MNLTSRQRRELDYHRDHAKTCRQNHRPSDIGVITNDKRRWWNGYWTMYTLLRQRPSGDETALVVGCGKGEDAILLTRLGYRVTAFDLSPDMIALARELADEAGLSIDYHVMTAENPDLPSHSFGLILARDILHHVEVPRALEQLSRLAKPSAMIMINENYTHSLVQKIRDSWLVNALLYPRLVSFVYKREKPYITADESKLNEQDLKACQNLLETPDVQFFNLFVTRIIPDSHVLLARLDRLLLMILKPIAPWLAGRFILFGKTRASPPPIPTELQKPLLKH